MEPNKTERMAEAAAPEAPQTPQTPKNLPVRRVGSLTLGVCLMAARAADRQNMVMSDRPRFI